MGLFTFEQEGYVNLNFIGQKFGLVSNFSFETLHSGRVITFAPPSFCMHSLREPYPVSPYFVRPQFFDQSGNEVLPEWVAKLPDLPTVYVTLGTEANDTPGVLQTIIDGLRDEPINLIATVGRNQNPADFGEQPPNVHIERYIPQSLLLPYCNLTVMHGGSNSLLQAVSAGLPLVIVPLIADQFFNADIVESLGLGQIVKLAQLNPDNVRTAVREGLNNPVYRHNIKRLRNEMQSLPELKSLQSVFNLLY
jgi:MGT family glycosyltransferase